MIVSAFFANAIQKMAILGKKYPGRRRRHGGPTINVGGLMRRAKEIRKEIQSPDHSTISERIPLVLDASGLQAP